MKNITIDNKVDEFKVVMLSMENIENSVVTLKEASTMLGVGESTIRARVLKGKFEDWESRKSGGTILFCKLAIEQRIFNFRKRT